MEVNLLSLSMVHFLEVLFTVKYAKFIQYFGFCDMYTRFLNTNKKNLAELKASRTKDLVISGTSQDSK